MFYSFINRYIQKLKRALLGPPSIETTSERLLREILRSSFQVFKDHEFRKMVNFSKLERREQDRILNELVVSGIALTTLRIETLADAGEFSRPFFEGIRNFLPVLYSRMLSRISSNQEYIDLWGQLIDLRCREYRKQQEKHEKKYTGKRSRLTPWIEWTITVSIGSLYHIRHGKTSSKDPLFKELNAWLIALASKIDEIIYRAVERLG